MDERIDFAPFFQVACGALGWRPTDFWESTFWEFSNTQVGYMKSNGIGPWSDKGQSGRDFRKDEVDDIIKSINKEKEDNPDGLVQKESLKLAIKEKRMANKKMKEEMNGK